MLTALAITLGMAAVIVPSTATAAPAADTAYLLKTQVLTSNPQNNPISCTERRIYLAEGHYDWGLRTTGVNPGIRPNMFIGAGWYTWETCLDPEFGDYIHTSWLDPDNDKWATATTSRRDRISTTANYSWGSFLDPKF